MDGNGGTSGDRLPRRPRWSWRSVFGDHSGETTDNDDSLFTAHLRRVLELARREALQLEHDYINTEHLLLGLLRESESDAVRVLFELHVGPEQIRREIMRALGVNEEDPLDQVESGGSY
jgi:ATP-dependent Clp protease ATP-binding subunit ClpA